MIRRIVKKNISAPYVWANVFRPGRFPLLRGFPQAVGKPVGLPAPAATEPLPDGPLAGTRADTARPPGRGRPGGRGAVLVRCLAVSGRAKCAAGGRARRR